MHEKSHMMSSPMILHQNPNCTDLFGGMLRGIFSGGGGGFGWQGIILEVSNGLLKWCACLKSQGNLAIPMNKYIALM